MLHARDETADFSYDTACDAAGVPARISVFADNPRIRSQIADDLTGAGFRSVEGGALEALLDGPITRLGDVVMIDCVAAGEGGLDARTLAALARLDMRVARSGAQLIVSTVMEALDDVFGALDQTRAPILVSPTRAERIVAVGRVMAKVSNGRVREMSEDDRLNLLRLSQQVEEIAYKLEGLSENRGLSGVAAAAAAATAAIPSRAQPAHPGASAARFQSGAPALPDAHLVRQMIAARQARARFFDGDLFADPAWDMLLDLAAAHAENARVSVTSLCIAAGVPATTALRWIKQMVDSGIFRRVADSSDRRRAFIELSEQSIEAMARYFHHLEMPLARAA